MHLDTPPLTEYNHDMNLDEWERSLITRRDALRAIIAAHQGRESDALEAIADYCDDPAAISSPGLIEDIETFFGEWEREITTAAEKIYMIGGIELGKQFCAMNELCAQHFCDLEICADDDHTMNDD
jgi:hypothetical protein